MRIDEMMVRERDDQKVERTLREMEGEKRGVSGDEHL